MEKYQFRCPRCGLIHDRKDGVQLSIIYEEEERYNPVPSGTITTSYYKNVYFCRKCDKHLRINRILRYTFVLILPIVVLPIYTAITKGDPVSGIGPGIVASVIIALMFLPLMVIVYRKIKIYTINKKYIDKAKEGNAIAY